LWDGGQVEFCRTSWKKRIVLGTGYTMWEPGSAFPFSKGAIKQAGKKKKQMTYDQIISEKLRGLVEALSTL